MDNLTPEQEKKIKDSIYEAGIKAKTEGQMVATQAQRLFYEYWNSGGHELPIKKGIDQFKKCMNMADEMRKIVSHDFAKRIEQYDKEMRSKYGRIIQVSAHEWADWRLPGT